MGIKRIVDTGFWTDDKVMDMFTPEDRLFMLYLMTNPHTTQLGIYKVNIKYIALELGYSQDSVRVLLDRFENKYNIIKYSSETKEIAIRNYLKYSIVKGGAPVRDLLIKELKEVKNTNLIAWVFSNVKCVDGLNETVKKIIDEYEEKNGNLRYCNENDSCNDSYHDRYNNDNENENENENENDKYNVDSMNESLPVIKSSKPSKQQIENEFERLWAIYPNKQGKKNALQSYVKARTRKDNPVTFEQIEQGINGYNFFIKETKTELKHVKHGSTWFNQECWNDDYTVIKRADTNTGRKQNGLDQMQRIYQHAMETGEELF